MFPFDKAALPQLKTRKALILVDLQNDFVDPNGALPATEPEGYLGRVMQLAQEFRSQGDLVWVQSKFDQVRAVDSEPILVSDDTTRPKNAGPRRSTSGDDGQGIDDEAFLSQPDSSCLKPDSWGAEISSSLLGAIRKGDAVLTKTHYSAFQNTSLLRQLRARMVMEVYICGSSANVGVYATALDAAGHGITINVVEDCCGYRHGSRQLAALKSLVDVTGCELLSMEETFDSLGLAIPDIVQTMAALQLEPATPGDATGAGDGAARKADSPQSSSKLQETTRVVEKDSKESTSTTNNAEKPTSKAPAIVDDNAVAAKNKTSTESSVQQAMDSNTTRESPMSCKNKQKVDVYETSEEALQKGLCEGDTDIIDNVLPESLATDAFDKLRDEVQWQRMSHQGGEVPRLIAVQGHVAPDGSMPVYRHPSDESPPLLPFSPTVLAIKKETERHLGHELNHVLIQFYRDGLDYISEHSDKTIDVVPGSFIANVSLGAERTMVFRTKRPDKDPSRDKDTNPQDVSTETKRRMQRAQLPHNSLCRMGLRTNMKWLHAIRQDRRADRDKTQSELSFGGGRISLTFRQIGTFLDTNETLIWGQGATGKTRAEAEATINGQSPQAVQMLRAFGTENRSSEFDWATYYGEGFDVLHMSSSPRFFASPGDPLASDRISLMLAEHGIGYARGNMVTPASASAGKLENSPIRFTDNDAAKSTVDGDVAIMLYLDARRRQSAGGAAGDSAQLAVQYTRFQRALNLRHIISGADSVLRKELGAWDSLIADNKFAAGDKPSLPDFALWPVLHEVVKRRGETGLDGVDNLKRYYTEFGARESAKTVVARRREQK